MKKFSRIRKIYWGFSPEIKEWIRAIIFEIPGKVGQFMRRRYALRHFAACGKNVILYPHIKIYNPQKLGVGHGVRIADYVQISAGGGVTIGNGVLIGPFAKIWSINHDYERVDIPITSQGWTTNPVVIEDHAWIAAGSILLPGSHIGKGAIISAGSVVRKKYVEAYSIVSGNPAKVVGQRIEKISEKKES